MDAFVDHLKQLCRDHQTRAKWVIVPGHGTGRTLGDRLVREGVEWANLRCVTPLDLALRMGAPYLVERGIDPSEDQLGPALIMRLLFELPGDRGYFQPLAHEPTLANALWMTMRELRMAGINAAQLLPGAFDSPVKHGELQALLAAYERHLEQHRLGDRRMVYEEALAHVEWCPVAAPDCWTAMPDIRWAPVEAQLLAAIPGERIEPAPKARGGSRRGGRAKAAHAQFFTAGGPEAEVEEVFRRILSSGRSLDEVEIACASGGYDTLVWEKACRYEWPVTLETGLPAALTRPGRALLSYLEWVEDDFAAGRFRRLLQAGDVRVDIPGGPGLGPSRAARLLVRADAAWGRDTYRLSLTRLARSSRARATEDIPDDEEAYHLKRAGEAEALAGWIQDLVRAVPVPDGEGLVDLQSLVAAAAAFVETASARHSALDHAAADRLAAAVRELAGLGAYRCPLGQALRLVRQRAESESVGADRPRPGHLHVSRLANAGWAGRRMLCVVGLEEGRVFPAAVEDAVLLDRERAAVGGLQASADRLADLVRQTCDRVDAAVDRARQDGHDVVFSYSCRDLRQFRATYASWVMLHAFRQATGNQAATYRDLHGILGPPVSVVADAPAQSLGAGRWWLAAAARGGDAARPAVLRAFPGMAQGTTAETFRRSRQFTEYDGCVPEAGAVLDPARPDIIVSPTQLEQAAGCPFRHFLRRGLGIEAIETGERDRDVWLNPLIRGSLLHDLYAEFHTRCLEETRAPTAGDRAWLLERGQAVLDETAREMPPPSVEVGERESREFLEDLAIFAAAEIEGAGERRPVALEAPFDNHVVKAGGLTFRIRGRIDRIDQLTDGTFEILDYKTGGFFAPAWKGTFAGGRRLQHALYGLAAAALLKAGRKAPDVVGATYYFSSVKGRQHQKHLAAPPDAELGKVLTDLRDVIAQGLFVHTPDPDDCKFCDYGAACGANPHERATAKLDDPVLLPFLRLRNYE